MKIRRDVAIMFCNNILGLSSKASGGPWSIESMEATGRHEMTMYLRTDFPLRLPGNDDQVGQIRVTVEALPPEVTQ